MGIFFNVIQNFGGLWQTTLLKHTATTVLCVCSIGVFYQLYNIGNGHDDYQDLLTTIPLYHVLVIMFFILQYFTDESIVLFCSHTFPKAIVLELHLMQLLVALLQLPESVYSLLLAS